MSTTIAGTELQNDTVLAGGIRTSYPSADSGDPVVLIHGSGPSWRGARSALCGGSSVR